MPLNPSQRRVLEEDDEDLTEGGGVVKVPCDNRGPVLSPITA